MLLNRIPLLVIKQICLLLLLSCCCIFRASTQPFITATDVIANHNEIVTLTVSVQHFTDILEFRYSVNWNPEVLEFVSISEIGSIPNFNSGDFDTSGTADGYFSMDWRDQTGNGATVSDFSVIYKINFLVLGFPGSCSELAFTNDPVPVFVKRISSPFNIGLLPDNGKVCIPTPPCRAEDSLALIQLYDQTSGDIWNNTWDLSQPLDSWYGVILGSNGCVEILDLDGIPDGNYSPTGNGNNLLGILPDLILPNLKKLYLSNNTLTADIPSFTYASQLEDIALDNNQFQNCPALGNLLLLENLYIQDNALTFEDIIPNINVPQNDIQYAPQGLIFVPTATNLIPGTSHIIDLNIDDNVEGSAYQWFKDAIEYTIITNNNQLQLNNVSGNEEGTYTVKVTNPTAPDLELCSHPIVIKLDCPNNVTNLAASICSGSSYQVGDEVFEEAGFYEVSLLSSIGCDSMVHLSLAIIPPLTSSLEERICGGTSYTIGNATYDTSGFYEEVLQTAEGCDSIVRLNLEVLLPNETFLTKEICEGSSITIGSSTFSQTGNYQEVLTAENTCDSTVFLTLTVHTSVLTNLAVELCEGESYEVGDSTYTTTGIHQTILSSDTGCDSIVKLNLTVHPKDDIFLTESICQGDTYPMGGNVYTATGQYEAFLTSSNGCDSTVYLDLTVAEVLEEHLSVVICEGDTYEIGTDSYSEAGEYEGILQSVSGCDSLVYLSLDVGHIPTTHLVEHICSSDSFIVGTTTYTETGQYENMLSTTQGCDSIVYLDLNVSEAIYTDISATICEGGTYQLGNNTYSQAGEYEASLLTDSGCDSIVQLTLIVNEVLETLLVESICRGTSFMVGNTSFSETGTYENTLQSSAGCDSIVRLNLSVLEIVEEIEHITLCKGEVYSVGDKDYNQTGSYTIPLVSSGGCDSLVHLELTIVDEVTFGEAKAGINQVTCNDIVQLTANLQPGTFGTWTTLEGAQIASPEAVSTSVTQLATGKNTFIWSLSTEDCPDFSSDIVIVDFQSEVPDLLGDTLEVAPNQLTAFDVLQNDMLKDRTDWIFKLSPPSDFGIAKANQMGMVEYTPYRGFYGNTFFSYALCNPHCPEYCAEATIWLKVDVPSGAQPSIIITPNGDGLNETLVFDDLDMFPNNEVIITNRWGSMVYKAKPYDNSWKGQNMNGQILPEGTYYYMMQFDVGEGEYQIGSVTVKR